MNRDARTSASLVGTGIEGLDAVLGGGLTADRVYLLEGVPGAGKTTIALQFLMEGLRQGETVLYITLSETEEELHAVAASHGWSLEGIHIHEMTPGGEQLYMATSEGNDPLHWNVLNDGNPVFVSRLGEQGVRDPDRVSIRIDGGDLVGCLGESLHDP